MMEAQHRGEGAPVALILGLTGGYGGTMAQALHSAGYRIRALVRDREKGENQARALGVQATFSVGDVLERAALARAAEGVAVVVHGVNAPYHQWDPMIYRMADAVGEAAARAGADLLFPGNVYSLPVGEGLDEETPFASPTKKGQLREAVETLLAKHMQGRGRLIILRGGDFFGVAGASSWMSHILEGAIRGGAMRYPTDLNTRHQWAFLPDFARAHVALIDRLDGAPTHHTFHFQGHILTGQAWAESVRQSLGDLQRPVKSVPWWLYSLLGLFVPMLRALVGMRYLWDKEVLMDGSRLNTLLGPGFHTPINEAVHAELVSHGWDPGTAVQASVQARAH